MKAYVRSIVMVLPLLLSSCVHKTNQAANQPPLAPPIEDAPLPKPDNAPANLPPPVISLPDNKDTQPAKPTPAPPPPTPAPKHRKSKTTPTPSQAPAPATQTTEQAANSAPEVPAIGDLSSGNSSNQKEQTQNMITETERSLNGINRKLNDQETKTSLQIREFLKQAKTALTTNDVDGAHTLVLKAKVLLEELSQ